MINYIKLMFTLHCRERKSFALDRFYITHVRYIYGCEARSKEDAYSAASDGIQSLVHLYS
jgi:hypothetical protein